MINSNLCRFSAGSRRLIERILRPERRDRDALVGVPGLTSYSQEGEDMVLQSLFQGQRTGFYVDVGAHHPVLYSNTYFFYRQGWRGINIDAMPGSMAAFRAVRPEDVNLEYAIAESAATRTYYQFDNPAVNGFSRELSECREAEGHFRLIGQREIPTTTLANALDAHLPPGRDIDFLSVDVEGLDLEVLRSNDWAKYRPKAVVAEDTEAHLIADLDRSRVVQYLRDCGFVPCSKCIHSIVMVDRTRFEPTQERCFNRGGSGSSW
jgi:FkbM family methyltransferase